jgi:hypothetical protein
MTTTSGTCWSASTSRASTSPRRSSRPASRTPPTSTSTSRSVFRSSVFSRIVWDQDLPVHWDQDLPVHMHAQLRCATRAPNQFRCATRAPVCSSCAPRARRNRRDPPTRGMSPHGGFLWSTFRLLSLHVGGVREPTVSSVPSAACLAVRSRVTCPVHGHGRVRAAGLGASLESSQDGIDAFS